MRSWWLVLGVILTLNLWALAHWHYDEGLDDFENLDVRVIVQNLQQPHHPLQWFVGDWALGNGFYRPLPSLLYELDYALWGTNLLAYKWLNGLIATLCTMLAVWWAYELSRDFKLALGVGFLFTLWQTGLVGAYPNWVVYVGGALGGVAGYWLWRDGRRAILLSALVITALLEIRFVPNLPDLHLASFSYRAVGWIPGRTATLMTLFALIALASYCRYARTGGKGWAMVSLIGMLGALGSYEGAIVLPVLMALCGWAVWRTGGRFVWWLPAVGLAFLALYGWLYLSVVPIGSDYQVQRMRPLTSLTLTLPRWLMTPLPETWGQVDFFLEEPRAIILPAFWLTLLTMGCYLVGWWRGVHQPLGSLGLLGALVAYAPLALVIPLMHYYYLPAVFRALWTVVLIRGILQLCTTPRPTRRAILVAMGDAMCPKRSSPL